LEKGGVVMGQITIIYDVQTVCGECGKLLVSEENRQGELKVYPCRDCLDKSFDDGFNSGQEEQI
jgi:hypothetical protein